MAASNLYERAVREAPGALPTRLDFAKFIAREGQKTKGMEQLGFLVRGVGREKAFVFSLLPEFAAWKDDEIFRALFAPDKKQQ